MVNRKSFYGMLLRTAVLKTYIYVAFPALPSFSDHTPFKAKTTATTDTFKNTVPQQPNTFAIPSFIFFCLHLWKGSKVYDH